MITRSSFPIIAQQSSRRWLWIIIGLAALAVVGVACIAAVVFGGVTAFQRSQREADAALAVIKEFMAAGAQEDAAAGVALFDPSASVTRERVAQLFAERRDVFQGSPEVAQESFTIYRGTNGITAALQGAITYPNQPAKRFAAQLRQTEGRWRLTSIQFADSLGS
jgi:hypothetical protein